MKVLLSIKPEYVDKILKGEKKYEFRRKIWKDWEMSKLNGLRRIVVYASSPVQGIVFEFDIDVIAQSNPHTLWYHFKDSAGICEKDFFKYFNGAEFGFAIGIGKILHYKNPVSLSDLGITRPPQNFMYLKNEYHLTALTQGTAPTAC